jgi:DNA replication and repair protein RecF
VAFVAELWLEEFRNYEQLHVELGPGRVLVTGENGQGKSNLLEAVGWLGSGRSFRRAGNDVLVRSGAERAIVRANCSRGDRMLLLEAELGSTRAARVQVNRQRLGRLAELAELVPVTVFAPDDLELVKGGPAERRDYLDDVLVQLAPRHEGAYRDLERILKQRNALLRQVAQRGGRLDDAAEATLAVWNERFANAGDSWARERHALVEELKPLVTAAYRSLAPVSEVGLTYEQSWGQRPLADAIGEVREQELRRGVTLAGPQRDELRIELNGLASRSHASQGEQRSLALALRMASHELRGDRHGTPPVLLLDDVFSELDASRAAAVVDRLEAEQVIITTTLGVPAGAHPDVVLSVSGGTIHRMQG